MIRQRGISTVFSGALALGLAAAAPARAAEGEFMRDAMSSIGLIEPERPAITYRERAPLVMPPTLSGKAAGKGTAKAKPVARKPARGKGVEAASADGDMPLALPLPQTRSEDPQWPKDPEVTRRQREADEARKPAVHGPGGRMNDNNQTLSAAEMQQGRRAGAGLSSDPAPRPGENRESTWLNPLQLFTGKKDAAEPSIVEPQRDGLTDPPTGYRKAPVKITTKEQGGPVGGSISGNEEADPRAYMRAQNGY